MQISLDLDNDPIDSIALAVVLIDDVLRMRRKKMGIDTPQAGIETHQYQGTNQASETVGPVELDTAVIFGGGSTTTPAAPPPPPVTLHPLPASLTGVASQASAPVVAGTGRPPPPAAVEYDSAGLPYDVRIHMAGRNKTIGGTWKNRRGLDKAILTEVMKELEPRRALPSVVTAPVVTTAAAAPVAPPPPVTPLPPPPPGSTVLAGQPAGLPPAAPGITFRSLMDRINKAQTAGHLTKAQVDQGLGAIGLAPNSLSLLISQPDKLLDMNAWLDATLMA